MTKLIDLFISLLTEEGYSTTGLTYARSSPAAITRLTPALIILDMVVRGEVRGWGLLSTLRLHPPTASIPVVVCIYFPTAQMHGDPQLRSQEVRVVPMSPDIPVLVDTVVAALADVAPGPAVAVGAAPNPPI